MNFWSMGLRQIRLVWEFIYMMIGKIAVFIWVISEVS